MDNLYERGVANGVPGLEMIGPERLKEIEPHTFGLKALWSPATGIIDYVKVCNAYAGRFQEQGGDIYMDAAVQSIGGADGAMTIETNRGSLRAAHVINCAGPVRRPHRRDDGRAHRRPHHPLPRRVLHPAPGKPAPGQGADLPGA